MFDQIVVFFRDIKLSHSIFALPFAFSVFFMSEDYEAPGLFEMALILLAIVFARTFAMGCNRILDRDIDALNPRTAKRGIPSGKLAFASAGLITLVAGVLFCFVSYAIKPLCGYLSVPVLLVLAFYSRLKRMTFLCHFYLGFCLALAPIAVSIVLHDQILFPVILLATAVTFWTAGFDILYATQDREFDQNNLLHSIPAWFGVKKALLISRLCSLLAILFFALAGLFSDKHWIYALGVAIIAVLFVCKHWMARNPKNIPSAFFTVNAWVSVLYLTFTVLDRLYGS